MDIKILEKTKNKLLFELKYMNHTFCNMLKEELWNDNDVKVSAYRKEHPLVSVPLFIVETSKKSPLDAVLNAAKSIEAKNKKFLTAFTKA
jgi:DNA-directed RNA polymerase subunit L